MEDVRRHTSTDRCNLTALVLIHATRNGNGRDLHVAAAELRRNRMLLSFTVDHYGDAHVEPSESLALRQRADDSLQSANGGGRDHMKDSQ